MLVIAFAFHYLLFYDFVSVNFFEFACVYSRAVRKCYDEIAVFVYFRIGYSDSVFSFISLVALVAFVTVSAVNADCFIFGFNAVYYPKAVLAYGKSRGNAVVTLFAFFALYSLNTLFSFISFFALFSLYRGEPLFVGKRRFAIFFRIRNVSIINI